MVLSSDIFDDMSESMQVTPAELINNNDDDNDMPELMADHNDDDDDMPGSRPVTPADNNVVIRAKGSICVPHVINFLK